MENLAKLMDFVSDILRENGFPRERIQELELATEEALVNIFHHAYAGQDRGDVEIRCQRREDDELILEFLDSGIPFEIDSLADPDLELSLPDRKVGGLGVFLIRKMVGKVHHRREGEQNVLTFILNIPKGK